MATITKKELIDRIADQTGQRRVQVKRVVQQFLDEVIAELGRGNRLEFRDFGVFETKLRKARKATKGGATPTVRKGLELLATQDVYDQLLNLRGKVKFGMTWQELRGDE